ncbi:hypothetical protein H0H93_012427, partial [Arthromyces matolae]
EFGTAPGPHVGPTDPRRKTFIIDGGFEGVTPTGPSKQPRSLEEGEDIRTHGSPELHRRTLDYILSTEAQDDTDGRLNMAYSEFDFDNTHAVYDKKRTEVALDTRHYGIDALD